jgi:hypothetical protein
MPRLPLRTDLGPDPTLVLMSHRLEKIVGGIIGRGQQEAYLG